MTPPGFDDLILTALSFLFRDEITFYRAFLRSDSCHAVHAQGHAGDVGGLVGSQEHESVGNVLELAKTAQGDPGDQGIDDLFGNRFHHVRLRDAKGHGVDADAFGAELSGQRARQAVYRKFGRGIGNAAGLDGNADHGGGGKDYAPASFCNIFRRGEGGVEHALIFRSMTLSKVSSVYFRNGVLSDTPALFARMSMRSYSPMTF